MLTSIDGLDKGSSSRCLLDAAQKGEGCPIASTAISISFVCRFGT